VKVGASTIKESVFSSEHKDYYIPMIITQNIYIVEID